MKASLLILALAGSGMAALMMEFGVPALPAMPPVAAQETAVVEVAVGDDGTVYVSPDPVTVARGGTVEWRADAPAWVVLVEREPVGATRRPAHGQQGQGPPEDLPLPPQAHENGLRGQRGAPARAQVRQNARRGSYKYSVVVWDGETMRVLDPELVID